MFAAVLWRFGAKASPALLAALLALVAQTLLIQPHVHAAGWSALAASHDHVGHVDSAPSNDSQLPCAICQTLASAGSATLATPAALTTPALQGPDRAAALPRAFVEAAPGHIWRSRAPPHRI